MSGTTPKGIVYPELDDAPNIAEILTMASSIDTAIGNVSARIGQSVTLSDGWTTDAVRQHTGTWTYRETVGGFAAGAATSNTTPIVIPAGLGGLYAVTARVHWSATASAASDAQIDIGGSGIAGLPTDLHGSIALGTPETTWSITVPLAAGQTLGLTSNFKATVAKALTGWLSAYRIGD